MNSSYICPLTKAELAETPDGLVRADGKLFPYINRGIGGNPIPSFLDATDAQRTDRDRQSQYEGDQSAEIYENFLKWLFDTFEVPESSVRSHLVSKLNLGPGSTALVTGCGLGDDLPYIRSIIGEHGSLFAQDLSPTMVLSAQKRVLRNATKESSANPDKTFLSAGDAEKLPFPDKFFDAAFHFGGINLFGDMRAAILEMNRVVRPGGKVVFGDEGVAPWLRDTEYGRIGICNNPLWDSDVPLALLPETCSEVHVSWILGNCFYLVDFEVSENRPHMNIDVPHKGPRGGTMRTRYFGQLEGISPSLKAKVIDQAKSRNMSVHEWLEHVVERALSK